MLAALGAARGRTPSYRCADLSFPPQQVPTMRRWRASAAGTQLPRAIVALRELSRATSANHRGRFVDRRLQKSLNAKRSVVIGRHKTSVSLEDAFWKAFNEIAASRNMTLSDLLARIDTGRHYGGLSSAIRLFVLAHYRAQVDARKSAERPVDEKGHSAHGVA